MGRKSSGRLMVILIFRVCWMAYFGNGDLIKLISKLIPRKRADESVLKSSICGSKRHAGAQ